MINPDDIKAGMVLGQADAEILRDAIARLNKMELCTLNAPDGWKLVPVEPTEEMIIDGFESRPNESFSEPAVWKKYSQMSGCQQAAYKAQLCWAAMLAAAPEVE